MQTIDINLKLNKKDYPLLFKLKKRELDKTIYQILDTGYSIMYPSHEKTIENIEKNDFNDKIKSLEVSLEKLIGLSSSSTKKGELAENILENIFLQRYGDIEFKNKSQTPHCGDAWLYLPNNKIIMLESKNYINQVNKAEVIKMQNDMITNHIKWGIFVSFNSSIQDMKDFDFHTFYHNSESYHVIMISNLSDDISRLDIALSIIRKLINMYSDLQNFPWIINNIKTELDHLNELLEQNYLLRDNFICMEKDIIRNINNFYTKLRDYQFIMDNKIKEIINKITSTMTESVTYKNIDYTELIEQTNKKLLNIITKLTDLFKKKQIIYSKTDNNLIYKSKAIAVIKLQNKKISIEFINYDLILNFILGRDSEINQNLIIFENLNF
jgi:hypothetical protein